MVKEVILVAVLLLLAVDPPPVAPPEPPKPPVQAYIPMTANSVMSDTWFCGTVVDVNGELWSEPGWSIKPLEVFCNYLGECAVVYDLAFTATGFINEGEFHVEVPYHMYVLSLHDGNEKRLPLVFTDVVYPSQLCEAYNVPALAMP